MVDQRIFIHKKASVQSIQERRRLRNVKPDVSREPVQDDLRLPIAILIVLLSTGSLFFVFRQVDPEQIANWVLSNSYFPVVMLFFFLIASGLYCFFLEIRRPIWWAVFCALILELKFQQLLSIPSGLFFLLPFALSEVVFSFPQKNSIS